MSTEDISFKRVDPVKLEKQRVVLNALLESATLPNQQQYALAGVCYMLDSWSDELYHKPEEKRDKPTKIPEESSADFLKMLKHLDMNVDEWRELSHNKQSQLWWRFLQ